MSDSGTLSVVIPVYNEEENIAPLVERCLDTCRGLQRPFEVILVDDGSRDGSPGLIAAAAEENPGEVLGVRLARNSGQHAAVMAGMAHAHGDLIVTLDADLQNPPEEIAKVVRTADEGYDVVGSVRVPRRDTFFRKLSSALVNRVTAKVTGVVMHDYGCMLRAYRRPVVDAMLQCRERSTFIPVLANSFAGSTAEIEVDHAERVSGGSKYGLWKLINLQFDLLTGMTTFPLRLLSVLGAVISVFAVGFGIALLVLRLVFGSEWAAEGVFTLFAILFLFVGLQFVAMGLLGEYLGRVYGDVRERPRYLVREVMGHSRLDDDERVDGTEG